MGDTEGRGCYVCHNLRKPLLCPTCLHKGILGDTALKTAQQRKQKLLEKLNRSLEAQVRFSVAQLHAGGYVLPATWPHVPSKPHLC